MALPLKIPKNADTAFRTRIQAADGAITWYFPVNPRKNTSINVNKNANTNVTIAVTSDIKQFNTTQNDPNPAVTYPELTDPTNADIIWNDVSLASENQAATDKYYAADDRPVSCIRIITTGAVTLDVGISIVQFDRR